MDKDIKERVRDELKLAHSLLEQFLGIQFQMPKPYIGDEHKSRFIQISSLKDIYRAAMIQGVYNDEINGIFVSDKLVLAKDNIAERIFVFAHECGHAFLTQQNHIFKEANIKRLIQSKKNRTREKGYIYMIFEEGFSEYVAIHACLYSGQSDLVAYAEKTHKKRVDSFAQWISFWEKGKTKAGLSELGFDYYKHNFGYYFMRTFDPDVSEILRLIQKPPSTIKHILYPEIYKSENIVTE